MSARKPAVVTCAAGAGAERSSVQLVCAKDQPLLTQGPSVRPRALSLSRSSAFESSWGWPFAKMRCAAAGSDTGLTRQMIAIEPGPR